MRRLIAFTLFLVIGCNNPTQTAPSAAVPQQAPSPVAAPTSGSEMFTAYCASCHGTDGRGHGPAAPAMKARIPDLTTLAQHKGGKFPEGDVFQVIKWGGGIVGHGSKEMPVWGTAFKPVSNRDEKQVDLRIKNLVQYLESIQQK